MRIIPLLVIALIIVALALTSRADELEDPALAALSQQELRALAQVHAINDLEIRVGRLALDRGSPQVEAYAKHLVADHEKADAELLALARDHHATLPEYQPVAPDDQAAMALDAVHAQVLANLSGASFDRTFLSMMVEDHRRALAALDAELGRRGDADAMALFARARPMVAHHEAEARELLASIQH